MCAKNPDRSVLRLDAPAKLNLYLAVTGRRPDGYHEIVSLMVCVGLCDTLHIDLSVPGLSVACPAAGVPEDDTNLALRAARCFFEASGLPATAAIRIEKRIPVGAGLGGGSSDAAAVLKGLNHHFGRPLDRDTLMGIALGLGADVPFFIDGQPAVARGIGERLTAYTGLTPMAVVIVYPGVCVSTAEVYGRLNLRLTTCEKKPKVFALKNQTFDVCRHLRNDLESVAGSMIPVIMEAKAALLECGADGALMTGSGSAVFGLFQDHNKAVFARDRLTKRSDWRLFLSHLIV